MIHIAIDPGVTGAIAWYDPDLAYLRTEHLPTKWKMVNKKRRQSVDLMTLWAMLRPWIAAPTNACEYQYIIEEPHGMPGAGAVSQFNFGATCGALWLMMDLLAAPKVSVRLNPSVWKRAMGCPSDKNRTRALAMDVFPQHKDQFAQGRDDGRAEAALMAYYVAHRGERRTA